MLPPHPPRPNVVAALPRCDLLFRFFLAYHRLHLRRRVLRSFSEGGGYGGQVAPRRPAFRSLPIPVGVGVVGIVGDLGVYLLSPLTSHTRTHTR